MMSVLVVGQHTTCVVQASTPQFSTLPSPAHAAAATTSEIPFQWPASRHRRLSGPHAPVVFQGCPLNLPACSRSQGVQLCWPARVCDARGGHHDRRPAPDQARRPGRTVSCGHMHARPRPSGAALLAPYSAPSIAGADRSNSVQNQAGSNRHLP
jgi:hypothetical protein